MITSMDRNIALNIFLKTGKWFSYSILRNAPRDELETFRILERLQVKLTKKQLDVEFNEACLTNELYPKYTNVKLHDERARGEEFVLKFRKELIQRQITELKGNIKVLVDEFGKSLA